MKYWLINYLSPFYLFLRIGFLISAAMVWIMFRFVPDWGELVAWISALLLVYNALRPWKVGGNFRVIQNKVDELSNRYK